MNEWLDREWLLTNALGGYASSTLCGANTRHYHGLLVAAFNPPTDRMLMVAKVEERVSVRGEDMDLSTNIYPDLVHPEGFMFLQDFVVKPLPKWLYGAALWQLEKSICMVQGSNATLIRYRNAGSEAMALEIHPLYAYSDYHTAFHENPAFDFYSEFATHHIKTYATYGSHALFTGWSAGEYTEARDWFRNVQLPKSQGRGLDCVCDYYRIGHLKKELRPNETLFVIFSTEEDLLQKDLKKLWAEQSRKAAPKRHETKSIFYNDLLTAGNRFLVRRASTKSETIIAGYHWFTDWGRDTMIALRGLTIATGRKTISKSILSTFFKSIDQGRIPDRFPDNGDNTLAYNSMDAALWLFVSTYDYYKKFGDTAFIKKHLKALKGILDTNINVTRYNIHVTEEGFLYGGQEGEQLTWMDAIVIGKVITPRIGCPVEVNALWYNALKIYQFFCKALEMVPNKKYSDIIAKFESNFPKMFINTEGTLYDVLIPGVSADNSFRPNQLFCLSLPFPLLDKEQQKAIFEAVTEKLLTPFGLRTLDTDDPNFEASYQGDQWSRDHAYHQGTVWPYLLYDYYCAYFRMYGVNIKNRRKVIADLTDLKVHFYEHEGIHCISEIFDGLEPNQGKGCIHQAWSVAALIKLYADYELFELDGD
ncbi:MAG: amylo-alpha-1,6-glucosidase [Flavobacteriaceae bacterium]